MPEVGLKQLDSVIKRQIKSYMDNEDSQIDISFDSEEEDFNEQSNESDSESVDSKLDEE